MGSANLHSMADILPKRTPQTIADERVTQILRAADSWAAALQFQLGHPAVAAIIPFDGHLKDANATLWPVVVSLLRNAFVEGLAAGLSNLPPKERR